jgi:NAD(P)-dependent dehydrogenase (short-subunit alcohol dehydrogenase family)
VRRSLEGAVAIVTGAGRGLGYSHATLLASEGAKVVVNDLGSDWDGRGEDVRAASEACRAISNGGGIAVPDFNNVADPDGAKALIDYAIGEFGKLDVLVCNAGILRDKMSFNMDVHDWDAVLAVHLRGHFLPVHYAAAHWRDMFKATGVAQDASVILTTSRAGLYGNAGQVNYVAAKAGIAMMAVALARELNPYGVRVNAIAPIARTRMTEGTFGEIGVTDGYDRWSPSNVSPLVAFLASPSGRNVSGQVFIAGGGEIQWLQGWTLAGRLESPNEPLTPTAISEMREQLFGTSGPILPSPFPTATWK